MGFDLESSEANPAADAEQAAIASQSSDQPNTARHTRLISRVLSPAVRLWLRSQVEHVDELQVQIEGSDRQLLSGQVSRVALTASNAVYQGLHLSQIQLSGQAIQINLGQVVRGKPLRLLAVVPVQGELCVTQADLDASLRSPLLASALSDLLIRLLGSGSSAELLDQPTPSDQRLDLQDPQILLSADHITISANLISASGNSTPVVIRTGLQVADGNQLRLQHPQWLTHLQAKRGLQLKELHDFPIHLGTDVQIQELTILDGMIRCYGQINVVPAE